MAGDGTLNISKAHSLIGLAIILVGAGATYMRTDNLAATAGAAAQRAHERADAAYAKAEVAEALARSKGDEAASALNGVNVKLARMEVMLQQLVEDGQEFKKTVRAIQEREGK